MKDHQQAYTEIAQLLDAVIQGSPCALPDASSYPQEMQELVEKISTFCSDISEACHFAQEIANGNLDVDPPAKQNLCAGPLKEIHSQLISFCWNIEQLSKGNMVSKLTYPGELYENYNILIDRVAKLLSNKDVDAKPQMGASVSSWRYHQILSALNNLHIMILEVDACGGIVFANPPAREMFENMKKLPYEDKNLQDDSLMKYLCSFAESTDAPPYDGLYVDDLPALNEVYDEGSGAWYKITTDRVPLTDGSYGMLHMIDDISEWKRYENQLQITATTDTLTSTYTRKAGVKKLEELIRHRKTENNCVAFVDIDDLKTINDKYGHIEGDSAIKTVAEILLSCVRGTDWIVRYGGDEFIVLFFNCPFNVAEKLVERMRIRLGETNQRASRPYTLSFSIGLAPITPDIEQVTDLIHVIDQQMYLDKDKNKAKPKKEKK